MKSRSTTFARARGVSQRVAYSDVRASRWPLYEIGAVTKAVG